MKSKIIFSIFTLLIFISGFGIGIYGGMSVVGSPTIGQLWAGAKEMQAAISFIDNQEPTKARNVLCNSIKTRLIIIGMTKPLQIEADSRQVQELEDYVYGNVKSDEPELSSLCK